MDASGKHLRGGGGEGSKDGKRAGEHHRASFQRTNKRRGYVEGLVEETRKASAMIHSYITHSFILQQSTARRHVMAYDLRMRSRGVLQGSARSQRKLGGAYSGAEHRFSQRVYVSTLCAIHADCSP